MKHTLLILWSLHRHHLSMVSASFQVNNFRYWIGCAVNPPVLLLICLQWMAWYDLQLTNLLLMIYLYIMSMVSFSVIMQGRGSFKSSGMFTGLYSTQVNMPQLQLKPRKATNSLQYIMLPTAWEWLYGIKYSFKLTQTPSLPGLVFVPPFLHVGSTEFLTMVFQNNKQFLYFLFLRHLLNL